MKLIELALDCGSRAEDSGLLVDGNELKENE